MGVGTGTGHPAILDDGFPWVGTLTYDTDHMLSTVFGASTVYTFDAELMMDVNGIEIRLGDVSFNETLAQRQLQIGAKLVDAFVILPQLPGDTPMLNNWLMTQFTFSGVWDIKITGGLALQRRSAMARQGYPVYQQMDSREMEGTGTGVWVVEVPYHQQQKFRLCHYQQQPGFSALVLLG